MVRQWPGPQCGQPAASIWRHAREKRWRILARLRVGRRHVQRRPGRSHALGHAQAVRDAWSDFKALAVAIEAKIDPL